MSIYFTLFFMVQALFFVIRYYTPLIRFILKSLDCVISHHQTFDDAKGRILFQRELPKIQEKIYTVGNHTFAQVRVK